MKYFTPDLIARFNSEDEDIALAAHADFEQRAEAYSRRWQDAKPELPSRFRELQERFHLHDASVTDLTIPWDPDLISFRSLDLLAKGLIRSGEGESSPSHAMIWPSFRMTLELETPPREIVVLDYRFVRIEGQNVPSLGGALSAEMRWEYDEVDLLPAVEPSEFRHSILFGNGLELRLDFRDFDFAILKPMGEPLGLAEPCPGQVPSPSTIDQP